MVRVVPATTHRTASAGNGSAARHKELITRNKPAYKVVLEQVTEKKKKLEVVVSVSDRVCWFGPTSNAV
jgi:hypothetical protein